MRSDSGGGSGGVPDREGGRAASAALLSSCSPSTISGLGLTNVALLSFRSHARLICPSCIRFLICSDALFLSSLIRLSRRASQGRPGLVTCAQQL